MDPEAHRMSSRLNLLLSVCPLTSCQDPAGGTSSTGFAPSSGRKSQLESSFVFLVVPAEIPGLNPIGPTLFTGPLLSQSGDGILRAGPPSCLLHPLPGSRDGDSLINHTDWKWRCRGPKRHSESWVSINDKGLQLPPSPCLTSLLLSFYLSDL